jgi:hypothetical protein
MLVNTTDFVELVPTATWPNEMLVGLTVRGSLVTPVPPSLSRRDGFEAVLVNVTLPPIHSLAVGANVTLRGTLSPADKINGRLNWGRLNSEVLRFVAETVTLVLPVFVKITS